MLRNLALVVLLAAVLYLCHVVARVENERYALVLGLCKPNAVGIIEVECLKAAETRTSSFWHVFYAISGS